MVWKLEKQTSSFANILVLLNGNGSAHCGQLSTWCGRKVMRLIFF